MNKELLIYNMNPQTKIIKQTINFHKLQNVTNPTFFICSIYSYRGKISTKTQ